MGETLSTTADTGFPTAARRGVDRIVVQIVITATLASPKHKENVKGRCRHPTDALVNDQKGSYQSAEADVVNPANASEELKEDSWKIKHAAESTRDYEKFLIEMQQRVIERPLIMEQQSIIAQKQKFTRKYEERLAAVGKDYGSGDFESEEETSEGKKQSPKSVSSSTSSSSGTASSKSSSSKKSHSSATSASSSSRNETKI
ncbi:hypothetical protein OSTOST_09628 [Ostertagia ostertagi]